MPSSLVSLLFFVTSFGLHVCADTQVPNGAIAVPLTRGKDLVAYYAELSVGTPPQKERLLVDTGSPTYSFIDPRSAWCNSSSKPCQYYGTFDNLSSLTSMYEGRGFSDGLIDFANGVYLNDTVGIGGVSTPHMYFGYVDDYPFPDQTTVPTGTIAGFGLDCGGTGPDCSWAGPFLLPQLKNASVINRNSVSVYLGHDKPDQVNAEMILGGAYDRAKVHGKQFTVDMVDPFNYELTNNQANLVNITAIEVVVDGKKTTKSFVKKRRPEGLPTVLDTGNAYWFIPSPIFDIVFAQLGSPSQKSANQEYYLIDCKYRKREHAKGHVSVEFGTAGNINVPIHSLVTDFGNGQCGSYIGNGTDDGSNLGCPFLRSAYIIFDQETFTMTLSQARYTDKKDIVAFPEGGFKVSR